ncbi:MAG: hypothetical protein AAFX06_17135 [Planctomycetota bacterium]
MDDLLSKIADAIEIREGLPRPKWDVIAAWANANHDAAQLDEVWTQLARDWITCLGKSLPAGYELHESPEFLLLAADESLGQKVLRFSERARRIILKTLDGVASTQGYGKHVILLFADAENYYDYVSDFYPDEGEFAGSGGMFLDVGYGHFAICPVFDAAYERVIAHELNHALLRHLPLPLWLNEGVTQIMEDVVTETSYFMMDHEILRRHRAYWTSETIDAFWLGDSFYFPDEGQELSYHLSQVLFRNLMSDFPKAVNDILKHASYTDAGNAAFINACNVPLADRVAQFLGDGNWAPRDNYTATEG